MNCANRCDLHLEGVLGEVEFSEFSEAINSAKKQYPDLSYVALTNGTCAGCHEYIYYNNMDYCVNQPLIRDLSTRGFFDNYKLPKPIYRME